jgi:hypothetical protein
VELSRSVGGGHWCQRGLRVDFPGRSNTFLNHAGYQKSRYYSTDLQIRWLPLRQANPFMSTIAERSSRIQPPVGGMYPPGSTPAQMTILLHELGHQLYAIPSDFFFAAPNREKTPPQLLVIVQPPSTATDYGEGPSWIF